MSDEADKPEVVNETPKSAAKPAATTAPKEVRQTAGVTVLQWLAYAFWGWLLFGLIWMLALVLMSFIIPEESAVVSGMLPYSIAAILVLLPVAFVIDFFYRKHEPVKKVGAAAVIMIIHAVIFALFGIGALIVAIFVGLNGLIEGRISDGQMVAIGTLLGSVVLYALALVRTLHPPRPARLSFIYWMTMIGISALLLVLGFVGPLASSLKTRDDRRIVEHLPAVHSDIQSYITKNDKAPKSLDDVELTRDGARDLVRDGLVRYKDDGAKVTGVLREDSVEHRYQLCVTYKGATGSGDPYSDYDDYSYERRSRDTYREYLSIYSHPKGEVCYKLKEVTQPERENEPGVDIYRYDMQ